MIGLGRKAAKIMCLNLYYYNCLISVNLLTPLAYSPPPQTNPTPPPPPLEH